jgi:phosphatidylglycerophosphatase A
LATAIREQTQLKLLAYSVATFFGAGYWPKGPGTAGSIAAILLAVVLSWAAECSVAVACLILSLLFLPLGVWASHFLERDLNTEDPQIIVVDEALGQWISLAAVPFLDWSTVLAALGAFRLFDIWKPWPVRRLENLTNGWGVIADDLMAGIYGAFLIGCLRLLIWN